MKPPYLLQLSIVRLSCLETTFVRRTVTAAVHSAATVPAETESTPTNCSMLARVFVCPAIFDMRSWRCRCESNLLVTDTLNTYFVSVRNSASDHFYGTECGKTVVRYFFFLGGGGGGMFSQQSHAIAWMNLKAKFYLGLVILSAHNSHIIM